MMSQKELVPKRRFEEFHNADTWEQCKLSDVADYYDGTHQTPKYTDEGVQFISVENIKDIQNSDKYISENDYERQFKVKPQFNDIFMTRITAGVIGNTALVEQDKPLAYYVSLALIRPKSIVPLYLEKYINSPAFKKELHMRIIHTAFPKKINLGDIGECVIKTPHSREEQLQIGRFFKGIDSNISLHQRKLEKTKALKSAYLAEMFPAEGEYVPKRRFAGFTGEWEKIRFEKILNLHASGLYMANAKEQGEYQVAQQGDMPILGYANGEPFRDYKKVILFGDHTLSLYKPRNPFFVATDGLKILSADILTSEFLYVLLNKYKPKSQGYKRHFTILQNEECMITNNQEEQKAIGEFFKKLDDKIANHQQKLEKLKATKQAYLNEMFV